MFLAGDDKVTGQVEVGDADHHLQEFLIVPPREPLRVIGQEWSRIEADFLQKGRVTGKAPPSDPVHTAALADLYLQADSGTTSGQLDRHHPFLQIPPFGDRPITGLPVLSWIAAGVIVHNFDIRCGTAAPQDIACISNHFPPPTPIRNQRWA